MHGQCAQPYLLAVPTECQGRVRDIQTVARDERQYITDALGKISKLNFDTVAWVRTSGSDDRQRGDTMDPVKIQLLGTLAQLGTDEINDLEMAKIKGYRRTHCIDDDRIDAGAIVSQRSNDRDKFAAAVQLKRKSTIDEMVHTWISYAWDATLLPYSALPATLDEKNENSICHIRVLDPKDLSPDLCCSVTQSYYEIANKVEHDKALQNVRNKFSAKCVDGCFFRGICSAAFDAVLGYCEQSYKSICGVYTMGMIDRHVNNMTIVRGNFERYEAGLRAVEKELLMILNAVRNIFLFLLISSLWIGLQ